MIALVDEFIAGMRILACSEVEMQEMFYEAVWRLEEARVKHDRDVLP